jgi:hypothetical protein
MTTLDKLILCIIATNTYLTYYGLCDFKQYKANITSRFIMTNVFSIILSIVVGVIFTTNGVTKYEYICYVDGTEGKELTDNIITSIIFAIFLYCIINSMLFLVRNIKELLKKNKSIAEHKTHLYRMIFTCYISGSIYLVSLLIINDSLFTSDTYIDLTYVINCLIVDLLYTINKNMIKETVHLLFCKKIDDYVDDFSLSYDSSNSSTNNFKNSYSLEDYFDDD